VRNFIRTRDFFKIASALETGAEHDMWTFQRYAKWLDSRTQWFIPGQSPEPPDTEPVESGAGLPLPAASTAPKSHGTAAIHKPAGVPKDGGRLEIEAVEGGLENILKKLK
jgi:hypothetical protein